MDGPPALVDKEAVAAAYSRALASVKNLNGRKFAQPKPPFQAKSQRTAESRNEGRQLRRTSNPNALTTENGPRPSTAPTPRTKRPDRFVTACLPSVQK